MIPATIFTLSQYGSQFKYSRVFREIAVRAQKRNKTKVVLHINDIVVPEENDNSKAAGITRRLIEQFSDEKRLVISENSQVEGLLSELANCFSTSISDKNLKVAAKIISEFYGV
jgi:hypothetical protein